MPAKNVNDNAGILDKPGAWTFFASKLAPTRGRRFSNQNVVAAFDLTASQRVPCAIRRIAGVDEAIHQVFI